MANSAVIRDSEKEGIRRSITNLEAKLRASLSTELSGQLIFGSYTRGTILPRIMDENSDVDYMVIFRDSSYKPQTYLDRLRRFVTAQYPSSEIFQSNPTVVLSLNHIKFELVPAIETFWGGLQIPAKQSSFNDWIDTSPNDVNQRLVQANQSNSNLIKPLIRLAKYWNARNGYPFASFELEKLLTERSYLLVGGFLGRGQLKDYFFDAMLSLELDWGAAQYKVNALNRAKQIINTTKQYLYASVESAAEIEIKKLLPPHNLLVGL